MADGGQIFLTNLLGDFSTWGINDIKYHAKGKGVSQMYFPGI